MAGQYVRGVNGDIYTDDNGVVRWQTGLLPANGASPAHWGARANDANNNPQFDTLGVIANKTLLAQHTNPQGALVGTVPDQVVCTVPFATTRTQTVEMLGLCTGGIQSTGGGPFVSGPNFYIKVTGQVASAPAATPQLPGTIIVGSATVAQVITLPAGSYVGNIFWSALNGVVDNLNASTFTLFVYLLGG